jgi:hypothetical protein
MLSFALDNVLVGFVTSKAGKSNNVCRAFGLIVHPDYRNLGQQKKIKSKVFDYSLQNIPMQKYLSQLDWL